MEPKFFRFAIPHLTLLANKIHFGTKNELDCIAIRTIMCDFSEIFMYISDDLFFLSGVGRIFLYFSYIFHIKAENTKFLITFGKMVQMTSYSHHNLILVKGIYPEILVKIWHDDVILRHMTSFPYIFPYYDVNYKSADLSRENAISWFFCSDPITRYWTYIKASLRPHDQNIKKWLALRSRAIIKISKDKSRIALTLMW